SGELDDVTLLIDLAKSAFDAGEYGKASRYATTLVTGASESRIVSGVGDAVHDGNLILGRVALVGGDVPAARRYLLAAGATTATPNLSTSGPNMALANDLLMRGETQAVLAYFGLCARFWSHGRHKLDAWTAAVKAGKAPDFGANLNY